MKIKEILQNLRPIRLIGLIGLMGLVGCSHDEVIDDSEMNKTAITFASGLQEETEVTRASALEDVLTNKTFTVYAYKNDGYEDSSNPVNYTSYQKVMPGFVVNWVANSAYTTTSNTNDWDYVGQAADQTIKYWDWESKAYRFFAYALGNAATPAPVNVVGGGVDDNASEVTYTTTVDASTDASIDAAPYFSRLWFSTGNLVDYPTRQFGKPVQLEFLKPMARVRFLFTFVDGLIFGREELRMPEFKPLTPGNKIATGGTVTVSYPLKGTETVESWSTTPTTYIEKFDIDYYEAPDPAVTPADALPTTYPNTTEKWYTVLPAENQGPFIVSVQVVTEEVKTATIPAEYMSWKAGYEYTYKFKITANGGITIDVIQVAINDWSNRKTSAHTVYNW